LKTNKRKFNQIINKIVEKNDNSKCHLFFCFVGVKDLKIWKWKFYLKNRLSAKATSIKDKFQGINIS
jgi:hypothetical protein